MFKIVQYKNENENFMRLLDNTRPVRVYLEGFFKGLKSSAAEENFHQIRFAAATHSARKVL